MTGGGEALNESPRTSEAWAVLDSSPVSSAALLGPTTIELVEGMGERWDRPLMGSRPSQEKSLNAIPIVVCFVTKKCPNKATPEGMFNVHLFASF